jgi:hypothetical protein
MGAINVLTNEYEYPKIATKMNSYKCPCCENKVCFRKGKVKKPHFAHLKSNHPCGYYDRPNETQIHKDAKMLIKTLLTNKKIIMFYRKCYYCNKTTKDVLYISSDDYNDTTAVIEHKFYYNGSNKSADVALLENKNIKYIIEICYKHKTKEENRPEPWVEINAEQLIKNVNNTNNLETRIECIRDYKCVSCIFKEEQKIKKEQEDEQRKLKNEQRKREEHEMKLKCIEEDNIKWENNKRMWKELKEREILEKKLEKERKEKELQNEKNELLSMKKEDIRRIQLKKENEERQKEQQRIYEEFKKQEEEFMKKRINENNKCFTCNINNCKCENPTFIKNSVGRIMCANCSKLKCMCVRITNFFKK